MIGPGQRFLDRFTIERSLGTGGFAEVWLACDDHGARYAIKVQRSDVRSDSALQAFAREGARAAALVHPHLVRVFESGVQAGRGYLVMEHVDGVTLEEELRRLRHSGEGLSIDEVRRWTRQLCQAIDALHAAALVHRDLKPSNVMVHGRDRRVKVLDLGLAHDAQVEEDDLTTLGRVKGTTAYMSPEQALGERVGPASDVFALTTIVFELLTGLRPWLLNPTGGMLLVGQRVPVSANDKVEVLKRLSSGRRPLPSVLASGLPPVLDHVFAAGWARDPAQRPVPTSAWSERLDAAFASVPPDSSAWLTPRRVELSSLAGARAPVGPEPRSATPVAQTMVPVEGTVLDGTVVEGTRLAPTRAWVPQAARRRGVVGAVIGSVMLAVVVALGVRERARVVTEEAEAPVASGGAEIGAEIGAVAPQAEAPASSAPERVAPASPPPASSAPERVAPPPPPPASPVAAPRPRPSPERPPAGRPSVRPMGSPTDTVTALRARLDRGAPLDEIARAIRAQAASLAPEQRRAIERWTTSALELDDARPLYLALDALRDRLGPDDPRPATSPR